MKTRIFNLIIIDESDSMNSTACMSEWVVKGRSCRFDKIAPSVSYPYEDNCDSFK